MIEAVGAVPPEATVTKLPHTPVVDASLDVIAQERFFYLLGPLKSYLDDPKVTNINVTGEDGPIVVERFGDGKLPVTQRMAMPARRALLMYLANKQGKTIDHLDSSLSVKMPFYGSRVRGWSPPIGEWDLIIRQHGLTRPMQEYVDTGNLSESHAAYLRGAIKKQKNIIVAGTMNSGKTAFLRSLLQEMAGLRPMAKLTIIQSDDELRGGVTRFVDKQFIFARVPQAVAGMNGTISHYTYEFSAALEDALQTNANNLIWGELRDGKSAVGLTMALNTGTRGFLTTIHADDPEETFTRLEELLAFEGKPVRPRMLAKFINVIAFMDYDEDTGRRRVAQVVEVAGVNADGSYRVEDVR